MRNPIFIAALLISVWWIGTVGAKTQSPRYALELRDVKGDDSNKIVSLRDKKLKHILWTRKVYSPEITWAKNKRAVFVDSVWHFLVWREGQPLRDFKVTGGYDYTMGCLWSPDNKRILIRFGMSAMTDINAGRLFCLRIGPGKTYRYSHVAGSVREMKWSGNTTVLYRVLDSETFNTSRQWHKWRIR